MLTVHQHTDFPCANNSSSASSLVEVSCWHVHMHSSMKVFAEIGFLNTSQNAPFSSRLCRTTETSGGIHRSFRMCVNIHPIHYIPVALDKVTTLM